MKTLLTFFLAMLVLVPAWAEEEPSKADLVAAANQILSELKLLDELMDSVAIERNLSGDAKVSIDDLRVALKAMPGKLTAARVRLSVALADPKGPKDLLGNPYEITTVERPPTVHPATAAALTEAVGKGFWGVFAPVKEDAKHPTPNAQR